MVLLYGVTAYKSFLLYKQLYYNVGMTAIMDNISLFLGGVAVISVVIGSIKYLYNKGKKKQSEENTVENISTLIENLEVNLNAWRDEVREDIDNEKKKSEQTHVKLFEKLETLSNDLRYLKGQFDQSNH